MNSIVLVIIAALVLTLSYRFYGAFIPAKVLALDETRQVPSKVHEDGRDYLPTNKWVLLGHHFVAIAFAIGTTIIIRKSKSMDKDIKDMNTPHKETV